MAKVSIIVPIYNVAGYLGECLDSVLEQGGVDCEVICVNDGSTDESLMVLKDYAGRNKIVIVDQENGGLSAARNAGFKMATGEYVYFLDADDKLMPGALSKLVKMADEFQLDHLVFSAVPFTDDEHDFGGELDVYLRYYSISNCICGKVMAGCKLFSGLVQSRSFFPSVPLRLMRRSAITSVDPFVVGVLHEDDCFTPVCLMNAERAMAIPDRLYCRRVRAGSIMTQLNMGKRHADGYKKAYEILAARMKMNDVDRSCMDAARLWAYYLQIHYQIALNGGVPKLRRLWLLLKYAGLRNCIKKVWKNSCE